jgi:hypothetical protein
MMNQALEFTRNLWIKAQLKAPSLVQRSVIPHLHEAKEIIRLLARPRLPVYEIYGQGQGGPLAVTYIGLDSTKPFLVNILFVETPVERQVGRVPFWRCGKLVNLSPSDIVFVEAAKHLIRRLPRQNAIIVPQSVEHSLDVSGEWQEVQKCLRKRLRDELRLTRKYGYQPKVSRNPQDFKKFYYDMYLPTMKSRHKALASPMPVGEAYEYFRHGLLFFVERDGRPVCGLVCHLKQGTARFVIMGIINGDEQLLKEGAADALYYLLIQWANQHGYRAISFLGSGARLNSGLFQYKRKWGTTIKVPDTLHRQIWIKIQHTTPVVVQFFKDNPFVIIDRDGKLCGLIVVDDLRDVSAKTKEVWKKRYETPGLSSLVVRSARNLANDLGSANCPDLVIPIRLTSSFQNGDDEQSI